MVILSDAGAGLHSSGGEPAYLQYIRHLEKTSPAVMQAKTAGTVENFAQGYQDYLQAPLQVYESILLLVAKLTRNTFVIAPHG